MRLLKTGFAAATAVVVLTALSPQVYAGKKVPVQLGPRPFYLVEKMTDSDLKESLQKCAAKKKKYKRDDFSIGHRGAALQFPEHTKESYVAAARMGAGIIECDVTFTADGELVCRHAQCDLHTTTNIVDTALNGECSTPYTSTNPSSTECCASDLTLAQFKTLEGKMDASNQNATTPDEFLGGTADYRTDLYATGGTLLSHAESIELIRELGAKFTPELKAANSADLADAGLTQEQYARKMIQEYIDAGIKPKDVWPQSFFIADVRQWIAEFPKFGKQAVFLDGRYNASPPIDPDDPDTFDPTMDELVADGVKVIAPPMYFLLTTNADNEIVPSAYAEKAREAGLDIISWTTERSGRIIGGVPEGGTFYYRSTLDAIENDGDILRTIDVLAQDVGIIGLFSDWPATTTFYANCML